MPHPLVAQLRFTRDEFMRGIEGVSAADARRRLLPMNSISWNVGHLAWQEQRYFIHYADAVMPYPDINRDFASGAPASTPELSEVLEAWRAITAAADPFLETLTAARLLEQARHGGRSITPLYGNLLQRTIYHYWYHNGENQAIRQQLGHERLPQFVGDIDGEAPYRRK